MKLRTRLLAVLLAVSLVGTGTSFLLVRLQAEHLFRSFLFSGDSKKAELYTSILGDYYAEKRAWTGVQAFLSDIPHLAFAMLDSRIHERTGEKPIPAIRYESLEGFMADRIVVADADGFVVADTAGKLVGTHHPPRHLAMGAAVMVNFRRVGTVLVGSMIDSSLTDQGEAFLRTVTDSLAIAALISGLLAFVLGLVFTVRITGPVSSLRKAVERVAAGDLEARVPLAGDEEIRALSSSFNAMTGELRALEEAKRRIIADSAHELRTPVTLIRGTIEAMLDGIYPTDRATLESVHEETVRLARLIEMLRELESIDSGTLVLERESVDLAELARKTGTIFGNEARAKGISLEIVEPGLSVPPVSGDSLRLGEVFYNLLSNAVRHTPEGGRIRVSVRSDASRAAVRVEDSGPGIPIPERGRIFERFYRLDRSRSAGSGGRGLGLSIAREIVLAHGGAITAGNSELGGASLEFTLPLGEPT
jgi:signal transduction histidine kinase